MDYKLMKSWIYYAFYCLLRLVLFPISIIVVPFIFPIRKKAYQYTSKEGSKWWHPLSIANWFFTKDDDKGDYYAGPYWFKRKMKDKYFTKYADKKKQDPIPETLKQRIVYFYLYFIWCGIRNYAWNLNRMLFKEGSLSYWLKVNNDLGYWVTSKDFTDALPQIKYVDKDGSYRDNSGPIVLFYDPNGPFNELDCTITGYYYTKILTNRGNIRPALHYANVINIFKWHLAIEIHLGWSIDSGWARWSSKFMFRNKK